jgi:hypothetical protein
MIERLFFSSGFFGVSVVDGDIGAIRGGRHGAARSAAAPETTDVGRFVIAAQIVAR